MEVMRTNLLILNSLFVVSDRVMSSRGAMGKQRRNFVSLICFRLKTKSHLTLKLNYKEPLNGYGLEE